MKTETKRQSDGAGATFYKRDRQVDPDGKPTNLWESYRFVCTYVNRPLDPRTYAEDMILQMVYWGGMIFPEINHDLIWSYIVERGYDGYLLYAHNMQGQRFRNTPGFAATASDQQKIMQKLQGYVQNHGHREKHIEILRDLKKLKGVEDLTNRDLSVAVGGCLYGLESSYYQFIGKSQETPTGFDIEAAYPKKRF